MGTNTFQEMPPHISGIYKITNIKTMTCYIGSSSNIKTRWITHRSQLNNNKHANTTLQIEWLKYGQENFHFDLLEIVTDKNALSTREQHWIDAQSNICNTSPIAARGGAKISGEMLKAQELLRQGLSAYAAAKQSGISEGAISKSKACQDIIQQRKAAQPAT